MFSSSHDTYVCRLLPNDHLKEELLEFARKLDLRAAYIVTCVGSLRHAHLRLADAREGTTWTAKMEIVSLVGTFFNGGCHLHISLADGQGKMIGGHLLDGCIIHTTAEIVIGEAKQLEFYRETDLATGHLELGVKTREASHPSLQENPC